MTPRGHSARPALMLVATVLFLAVVPPQVAAARPVCTFRDTPPDTTLWQAPLNRIVSFNGSDISLRDALDRLAVQARIRLSYSGDALPLDRQVCLSLDSAAAGDVLTTLLRGIAVRPVVAAPDYVVLTPVRPSSTPRSQPLVLDRIVVTGSASGASQRPLPVAIDVVDGRDLSRQSLDMVSQTLDGAVPGMWAWEQAPTSLLAQYGSIRGASSFGLSYPKVYIDGIEVANPLLLTRFPPDAIERVEVIRGPQGAALYGADAISGITNIVTRQPTTDEGTPAVTVRSDFGAAASDFVATPTLRQHQTLNYQSGGNMRSFGVNVTGGTDGAFVPGSYARYLTALGTGRRVGEQTILTGMVRVFGEQAAAPVSPLLSSAVQSPLPGTRIALGEVGSQSVFEYTAGTTLKYMPSARWKHTIVAGIDGYTLDGVPDDGTAIPSAADSALNAARGGALRATLRASSVRTFDLGPRASADLTLTLEQSALQQRITTTEPVMDSDGMRRGARYPGGPPDGAELVGWRNNSAASLLLSTTVLNRLFVSGGLRAERATHVGGAVIPMLGGAWVRDMGPVTLKLRAAYGKGVRWPETTARETLWEGMRPEYGASTLQPEEQSGVEGGFDLIVANALTLQVTRFDQTASGLIQRVAVAPDTTATMGPGLPPDIHYQLQNVGSVSNKGWEFEGSWRRGAFALNGTLSLVDSRVTNLAAAYTGDLQPGDRMLAVPARTISLTAQWTGERWTGAFSVYGAQDWINYDRVALAQAYSGTTLTAGDLVGVPLRTYWITYRGVAHTRASFTWYVRRGLGWTLTGDNLLDRQIGEPDNVTVLPGRTISMGVRAQF